MTEAQRNQVLEVLKNSKRYDKIEHKEIPFKTTPLNFGNEKVNEDIGNELIFADDFEDIIYRILIAMRKYGSFNPDGSVDCGRERRRTATDIWRHVQYYFPEKSIFDIMHELGKCNSKKFYGFKCGTINQQIFVPVGHQNYPNELNMKWEDEFGLIPEKDWKNI
jgi:hypothetical protein